MSHCVGLDVGKHSTSICIVDQDGLVVKEGSVPTEPRAIITFLRGEKRRYRRVGIEAMSMAAWLYQHLAKAGLPIICIDAKHGRGILKARRNKTDRNDARGIAEMMRVGAHRTVHIKTVKSQEAKLLLAARKLLVAKCRDVDSMARSMLLQFGHKLRPCQTAAFDRRIGEIALGSGVLRDVVDSLLVAHRALLSQIEVLERSIRAIAMADPVCCRLMTAPGMGPLTVLPFRAAIDVPERFARSRDVAVHLGLTPRSFRSGTIFRQGRISKCGDREARSALYLAALSLLQRNRRVSALRTWGEGVVAARGYRKGLVAVARRLAVILHRMWLDETDFRADMA